jgi:hypothetical protein
MRMRWEGYVARMGRRGMYTGFCWESKKERDRYDDLGVGMRIMLKWILEKLNSVMVWIHLTHDKDQWCVLVNG